jgi:hypothetical protein
MASILAPIIFFAYNRPDHTRQTLEALNKNSLAEASFLRIYVDGPKAGATAETIAKIEEVKKVAAEKKWCGTVQVIVSKENKGLVKSIAGGVTETVDEFGKVIVIEDDILVSPGFLTFMNEALDFYEGSPGVMHISGFSRPEFSPVEVKDPTYFFYHTSCWGWATWKRAWDKFIPDALAVRKAVKEKGNIRKLNMDGTYEAFWGLKAAAEGKLRSWNVVWHSSVFLNDGLCLHPTKSLVSNIGHDGSGTNCVTDDRFTITENAMATSVPVTTIPLENHEGIRKYYLSLIPFKERMVFAIKHYMRYLIKK